MNFNKVKENIERLGDYDEPTFNLVSTSDVNAENIIKDVIAMSINVFHAELYSAGENLWFYCLDTSHVSNELIACNIAERLLKTDKNTKIASFRHNCIGEPSRTLAWCQHLLEEATVNEYQSVLVNDFKDRDNWQGVDKYFDLGI